SVLAERLFEQWPVALVDEFQDTDSLQFAILDRIYRHHSNDHCNARSSDAVRGRLVMIGDPKQAIYRFRGGDIDAYLRAARQAGEHLALATNHRSADAYVDALNRFYALAGAQLGSAGSSIAYRPVASSGRR